MFVQVVPSGYLANGAKTGARQPKNDLSRFCCHRGDRSMYLFLSLALASQALEQLPFSLLVYEEQQSQQQLPYLLTLLNSEVFFSEEETETLDDNLHDPDLARLFSNAFSIKLACSEC